MPISYYVWAIVNENRTIVVDTGFDRNEAAARRRRSGEAWRPEFACLPAEGLAMAGIDARAVEDVIVTHMHFDHIGTLDEFPRARFHLQELEMAYATGRHMAHGYFAGAYTVDDVIALVRHVFAGRVAFHNGDAEIAPGITVHRIGGHTMGIQCVRVLTTRGWVVRQATRAISTTTSRTWRPIRSSMMWATCWKASVHSGASPPRRTTSSRATIRW